MDRATQKCGGKASREVLGGLDIYARPFLPGLNIAFNMDARQVIDVYEDANLEFRHAAEKRWRKEDHRFVRPEEITAAKSCLPSLNQGLVSVRYLFEHHRLDRIYITRVGSGDSAVQPLIEPLQLRKREADRSWAGLDGSIIV